MISAFLNRLIGISVSLALLTGCVSSPVLVPVADPEKAWAHYQPQLTQFNAWHLIAETGIVAHGQGQSANVDWQQKTQGQFSIELYGPLGLGATMLTGIPGTVTLRLHNGNTYQASNAELLMQQVLGWSLPVEGLIYWIRGLPDPSLLGQLQLNAYGTLASLTQQGWVIQYQQYQAVGSLLLPTKIKLTHDSVKVIIVIRQWSTTQ